MGVVEYSRVLNCIIHERIFPMPLAPDLLQILACPACKSPIFEADSAIFCTNGECRRRYPITDEIPVMLVDESTVLEPNAWQDAMQKKP